MAGTTAADQSATAHSQLLAQINEFNRYPMRGLDRMNTLELLRETVGYVQDNYAKNYLQTAAAERERDDGVRASCSSGRRWYWAISAACKPYGRR
jgi:hypothetical protein